MGGVIISEPEEGSPIEDLPWVVVFQSLDDAWDSFTCGPYERDHAIALAEAVAVEEDDVLAAVEPLLPALEPADILADIAELREVHEDEDDEEEDDDAESEESEEDAEGDESEEDGDEELEITDIEVPDADEVREGMARVVNRLLADA
ncbi:hypothetical protein NLX83_15095 [Allokutzneria sp. A3M-2-11 16]|uniref:hypothetical protein n=1 Tax=Allokutzneria sp. A3M-2-11 16 TaxID=2962043 RepID=UPI0020B8D9ED|nr:hypothetical protein [Allokutzneria sp. A3M-2-11 16]MCP3800591.1 hypothetical protein [Allokutzneria sp. A3M-2-11 16]